MKFYLFPWREKGSLKETPWGTKEKSRRWQTEDTHASVHVLITRQGAHRETQSTNQKESRREITKVANGERRHKRPYTPRHDKGHADEGRENAKHTPKGEEGRNHEGGKQRTHTNVHILYEKGHTEREGKTQSTNQKQRRGKLTKVANGRHTQTSIYLKLQTKRRGVEKQLLFMLTNSQSAQLFTKNSFCIRPAPPPWQEQIHNDTQKSLITSRCF